MELDQFAGFTEAHSLVWCWPWTRARGDGEVGGVEVWLGTPLSISPSVARSCVPIREDAEGGSAGASSMAVLREESLYASTGTAWLSFILCYHLWKSINLTNCIVRPGKLRHPAVTAKSCAWTLSPEETIKSKGSVVNVYCDIFSQASKVHTRLHIIFR